MKGIEEDNTTKITAWKRESMITISNYEFIRLHASYLYIILKVRL